MLSVADTIRPRPAAGPRMYWKMSIDLSYPLVPSMGQHDPLDGYATFGALQGPAAYRLAFRELGLSIGLHALERLATLSREGAGGLRGHPDLPGRLEALAGWLPLKEESEAFWREPAHRRAESWRAHEDINTVMLATSLAPDGYLGGAESRPLAPRR